jgi:putative ABC transport system permease protein
LTLGLAAAFAVTRGLDAMLFEVTAVDPITFAGAGLAVLSVAGLAALIPAIRAMRVDPVRALRTE